jgi:hypothetical protein
MVRTAVCLSSLASGLPSRGLLLNIEDRGGFEEGAFPGLGLWKPEPVTPNEGN